MANKTSDTGMALGQLTLRLGASGLLIYGHGWPKLTHFAQRAAHFPDPLHVGHTLSLSLVVFAEVVCAGAVALGLLTRLAVIPLLIFFGVAAFVQNGAAPFADKELALIFAVPYIGIALIGPGRFSVDAARGGAR